MVRRMGRGGREKWGGGEGRAEEERGGGGKEEWVGGEGRGEEKMGEIRIVKRTRRMGKREEEKN